MQHEITYDYTYYTDNLSMDFHEYGGVSILNTNQQSCRILCSYSKNRLDKCSKSMSHIQHTCTHMQRHTLTRLLFNWTTFPELFKVMLLQLGQSPKSKLLGVVVAELLQAECTFYHPNNNIKAHLQTNSLAPKPTHLQCAMYTHMNATNTEKY